MTVYPWMIDAILVGVLIEFFVLSVLLRRNGSHDLIPPLFFFLLSGGFLLSALRLELSDAPSALIALALLCGFFSHAGLLVAVFQRFRKA